MLDKLVTRLFFEIFEDFTALWGFSAGVIQTIEHNSWIPVVHIGENVFRKVRDKAKARKTSATLPFFICKYCGLYAAHTGVDTHVQCKGVRNKHNKNIILKKRKHFHRMLEAFPDWVML